MNLSLKRKGINSILIGTILHNKLVCKTISPYYGNVGIPIISSIPSNAEQSAVHNEVQGMFHTNHQQESLLKFLHNHPKIDLSRFGLFASSNEIYIFY